MPGFLGGSSGSSGTGGEITFPKEFIDPVTKLRVSQPENLIDTDFEYGLQPTKWETVELINNTPSFFSKSGDTTIPGIVSIATNNGTREITVTTATDHGLAVGIPINVTGTKSVTADGSYVINSIPNLTTFTYLCKDEQIGNNSIEDLYSSIITGEFFQGSQIRIADAEGVTTDAEAISTLTVKTDSTHGFGLNTPFYFLNLNSTISQEFEAANTAAKSFDSSNSATAQTFDGSNTLSTFNIDWSNSAVVGGTTSTITDCFVDTDTIRVTHGAETFAGKPLGTPLYYNLSVPASSGYFSTNPRGVVFLKTTNALNTPALQSTFQVSATPDGDAIDIVSSMSGTFQLANQARTFAGNNVNPATQTTIAVVEGTEGFLDAANNGGPTPSARVGTVTSYSGSLINLSADDGSLDLYQGAMVRYTASSAAANLALDTTYFVDSFFSTGGSNYAMTIKNLPGVSGSTIGSITGGTGTQKFTKVGVSVDRDIFHVKNNGFALNDMVRYTYPAGGRFTLSDAGDIKDYYFVTTVYDAHNFQLDSNLGIQATGGVVTTNSLYKIHTYSTVGSSSFVVASGTGDVEVMVVAGGGAANSGNVSGSGGAGGIVWRQTFAVGAGSYPITVGNGGQSLGANGSNSTFSTLTAIGGGGGGQEQQNYAIAGGSGAGTGYSPGGAIDYNGVGATAGAALQPGSASGGFGNAGGRGARQAASHETGGGGGAGLPGADGWFGANFGGRGGIGRPFNISGTNNTYYGGGGGGSTWTGGDYGAGGRGGGGRGGRNGNADVNTNLPGTNGLGGGAGAMNSGGALQVGGSGIVIVRYPLSGTWSSGLGTSSGDPAWSATQILAQNPGATNGTYWIRPRGSNSAPFEVYCDMTNGGWMRVASEAIGVSNGLKNLEADTGAANVLANTAGASGIIGSRFLQTTNHYSQVRFQWDTTRLTSFTQGNFCQFTVDFEVFQNNFLTGTGQNAASGQTSHSNSNNRWVSNYSTNVGSMNYGASGATFGRVADGNGVGELGRHGFGAGLDTLWAIKARTDVSYGLGCNNGGWSHSSVGAFYPGGSYSGGFTGASSNGVAKNNVTANNLNIWIR